MLVSAGGSGLMRSILGHFVPGGVGFAHDRAWGRIERSHAERDQRAGIPAASGIFA